MHVRKERIINQVDLKIKIYLKELWQECEEGCKSIFKEMEDTSKETEISRVH